MHSLTSPQLLPQNSLQEMSLLPRDQGMLLSQYRLCDYHQQPIPRGPSKAFRLQYPLIGQARLRYEPRSVEIDTHTAAPAALFKWIIAGHSCAKISPVLRQVLRKIDCKRSRKRQRIIVFFKTVRNLYFVRIDMRQNFRFTKRLSTA